MAERDLINITDLSVDELETLLKLADDMYESPETYSEVCHGKKLATLFYEPSTRTRLSFEAAMLELGGSVIGFSEAGSSSTSKGETVADTARVVSHYADIIAIRHPLEGAALAAANGCDIPVINAGDGGHFHPTQTLTDLFTIWREKGRLSNISIGMCGDLKYGRTVHSLIDALLRYDHIDYHFVSPEELKLPDYIKDNLNGSNVTWVETTSLEDAIPNLDILYMTRIQEERFPSRAEYEKHKGSYILDEEKMRLAHDDMIVMHPLPRVDEISVSVDSDPRAKYFEQTGCGKVIRKALISALLFGMDGDDGNHATPRDVSNSDMACANPKCITNHDRTLPKLFREGKDDILRCVYCDCAVDKQDA